MIFILQMKMIVERAIPESQSPCLINTLTLEHVVLSQLYIPVGACHCIPCSLLSACWDVIINNNYYYL